MRPASRRWITTALVFIGLGIVRTSRGDDIDANMLACEEAVAHLVACCPSFDAHAVYCQHYESTGCDPDPDRGYKNPALDLGESHCVRAMSCDVLVASGVCKRAQVAGPHRGSKYGVEPQALACP